MQSNFEILDSLNIDKFNFYSFIASFNNNFSIDWLVTLLGQKASKLISLLEEGVEKGWLEKKTGGTFYFKDMNIRTALEDRLPAHNKDSNHRKIVKYLMTELKENDEKLLLLSHHLQHIKCNGALCKLLMQAGDFYLKSFKQENALECYAKILKDLSDNEDISNDKLFIESAIKYSKHTTAPMHGDQAIIKILKAALRRAKNQGIKSYEAHIYMHLAKNEWICSQNNRAISHFEKGWALALKLGQKDILRSAHAFAMYFSFWKGCYLEGINSYERFVPDIQIYHEGQFPLLAALLAGHCYGQVGHISQGIGMLEALYNRCHKKNDLFMAAYAKLSIGIILLDMGKTHDALDIIEPWMKIAQDEHNDWAWIWGELGVATAYYRTGNNKMAIDHLGKFLDARKQAQMNLRFYPYILELCFAIKTGKLPHVNGLSFEKEIEESISGKNVFLKGVAYRYKALQQKQEGAPIGEIIKLLNTALTFLTESGQKLELAMIQFDLARQYALSGNKEESRRCALIGSENLSLINKELIPDDIKEMLFEANYQSDRFGEILHISQELMAIRDNKELIQNILSRVNRITGAERGAIFLLESDTTPAIFNLRASKNLTIEDIDNSTFNNSLAIMRKSVEMRKGIIRVNQYNHIGGMSNKIRSCICVPMIIKDKVIGVLYNDNSILKSEFKDEDLDTLSYFANLAASALENAMYFEEIQHLNAKLKEEKLYYEEQQTQSFNFDDMIGDSTVINSVFKNIEKVADTDSTVLIYGETGVGKEMVARAIHKYSKRRANPFIRVFCNALPEALMSSELFGHEKGAFTGAHNRRMGRFELADGGTLFLDEIGDLPLDIQTKLLIVLQSKEFERVGGSESISSDFRLIVATNRNLEEEVHAKNFRSDLYYRINTFPIYVPALRERKEDIPLLVKHFLNSYTLKMGKNISKIPMEEMNKLIEYNWPGNIRELDHVIERGVILSNGPNFKVPELEIPKTMVKHESDRLKTLREIEKEHILSVLQKTGWKIRGTDGAAGLLDINPTTLEFRMKKLGLKRQHMQKNGSESSLINRKL